MVGVARDVSVLAARDLGGIEVRKGVPGGWPSPAFVDSPLHLGVLSFKFLFLRFQ